MNARSSPVLAMVMMAAGGGLAVLATGPSWDSLVVTRVAPLAGFVVEVSGRTVEPAVAGLGVVALAGVVALLATRGAVRRAIGAVVAVAGLALGWRAGVGLGAVPDARAHDLVLQARTGTSLDAAAQMRVEVHQGWPALAVAAAVLVVAGGALVVTYAGRWRAMSARYDAPAELPESVPSDPAGRPGPPGPAGVEAAADLAMWKSLDRGHDPTL